MTFIDEHSDRFAVTLLLGALQISTSTYYAWRARFAGLCDRDLVDRGLLSNIHDIWTGSGCTYGADRVHRQLRRDGIRVGRKRVERLMASQDWQGAFLRRGWRGGSTVQDPRATPAPDLANRNFTAVAPNRLWVADTTRIRCGDWMFWLAAVRDAFSNRIVGWKAGDRCDTDRILGALEYGIRSRDVRDQALIQITPPLRRPEAGNHRSIKAGEAQGPGRDPARACLVREAGTSAQAADPCDVVGSGRRFPGRQASADAPGAARSHPHGRRRRSGPRRFPPPPGGRRRGP